MLKTFLLSIAFLAGILLSQSHAKPEYSVKTGESCASCHTDAYAGKLSEKGLEYASSGYRWPPEGGYRVLPPSMRTVRTFVGFIHIVSAFMWFGTILYVHIVLKPAYASKGLPKAEVSLGLISMIFVGITGAMLTTSKINSLEVLFGTPWGMMLAVKILLYLVMISSALFIVLFVAPRLRNAPRKPRIPVKGIFDPMTLSSFDGKDGRPAFMAFKGRVYDVTGLRLWKDGTHMKHLSGEDLTDSLGNAPHGEEKLAGLNAVGSFDTAFKPEKTAAQKAFYFVAYMNLSLVFCVLLAVALLKWGH